MILSREQILAATQLPEETVAVPEWGGSVIVRGLTGAQRDHYESTLLIQRGTSREFNLRNARAKLVAMVCVDEAGKKLFTGADVEALGQLSAAALNRVWDAGRRLSGLGDEDVEELVKNSESDPSVASGSD